MKRALNYELENNGFAYVFVDAHASELSLYMLPAEIFFSSHPVMLVSEWLDNTCIQNDFMECKAVNPPMEQPESNLYGISNEQFHSHRQGSRQLVW